MNQDVNLLKYLATVDASIGKLYDKLIKELAKIGASISDLDTGKLFSFADYPQVKDRVEKILDKYTDAVETRITDGMKDAIDMSYLANTTFLKDYSKLSDKALNKQRETAKEAFIRSRRKSKDGLGLSNRVWNYTNQAKAEFEAGMSEVLEEGLSVGMSAEELGRKVRDKLRYPDMVYKRYHLKKLTKEGKKDVIEWRKKVIDEDGKVRFIKTELDMVGRGVYRSSRKNALRLAATEINMAYRYADNVRWQSEPFIRGIRIRLSKNHTCNGQPFFDICDELQGDYPKTFMWSGWHPRCYSDDSEVLTSDGWKLFKDVTLFDGILSLNPNNKEVELVSIVSLCKWYNNGVMVRIYGSGIDYLVTEDHEILIENDGKIGRIKASSFDCNANSLFDCSCDLRKDIIEYNGYVYDLELERNHIMYIRRNGKCFWGSNCRCSASPILIPQEEMDKISKLPEDEYQNYRPKDLITEMPNKFKSWFEQNKDKIEASIKRGTQPYFIRDNKSIIDILLRRSSSSFEYRERNRDESDIFVRWIDRRIASLKESTSLDDLYKRIEYGKQTIIDIEKKYNIGLIDYRVDGELDIKIIDSGDLSMYLSKYKAILMPPITNAETEAMFNEASKLVDKYLNPEIESFKKRNSAIKGYKLTNKISDFDMQSGIKRDIDEFYTSYGIRIIKPSSKELSKLNMFNEKDIYKSLGNLPNELLSTLHEVYICDFTNPYDHYWAKKYNMPNFKSFATGGDGIIRLYKNNESPKSLNLSYLITTMQHECGHNIDRIMGRISDSELWMKAMDLDYAYSELKSITEYGKAHAHEDFAESIMGFCSKIESFKHKFPYRYSIISAILKSVYPM